MDSERLGYASDIYIVASGYEICAATFRELRTYEHYDAHT